MPFCCVSDARMGNAAARERIKARDFEYLAKFTGFVTMEVKGAVALITWCL